MRSIVLRVAALLLLCVTTSALAGPPGNITYQGTLGSAEGQPVNGTFTITFRLYFGLEDATAYWEETHTVDVDDGKFSVELGDLTPMPNELFGAPLFLGIQVQGDVEMTPRLRLSATPYAFRARSLMRGTIHVPADGTPADNGAALLAAVASVAHASADSRYVVNVDAGDFDLGDQVLAMPSHVQLVGAGPAATLVRAARVGPAVLLQSHTGLTALGVLNQGSGGTLQDPNVAIGVAPESEHVAVRTVAATSMPAGELHDGAVHTALRYERLSHALFADMDIHAERGQYVYGIRGALPQDGERATDIVFRDIRITGSAAPLLRGVDLSSRMDVVVDGMSIRLSGGGVAPSDVAGFRGQIEIAMDVRNLDVQLDFADTTPEVVRAIAAYLPLSFSLRDFNVRAETGSCSASGFRAGFVFWNVPPEEALFDQGRPRISNGEVAITSADCGVHGITLDGSSVTADNVQVEVVHTGANGWAFGFSKRATGFLCTDAFVLAGQDALRDSTITATSELAEGNAVDMCAGTLSIENSTLSGSANAFRGTDNEVVPYDFSITHSRLHASSGAAAVTFGEAQGRISHSLLDAPASPVSAFADPGTGLRSSIACIADSTPTGFAAGPACPCTAGLDCPGTP